MPEHFPVIIVGGGQAGLASSYCLQQRGVEHVIFERHGIAHEWRARRWDSFCLVTPNWQCQLPGFAYPGNDPHGFMPKDDIVRYLESYVAKFAPPLRMGVSVNHVRRGRRGGFELVTSVGDYTADQVVIAVGGYHHPIVPRLAERLPTHVMQMHSSDYKNPQQLPAGAVLVVGTGQSGCQIAEDLHLAARQVHLCVGGAPRSPRQYRGKDAIDWLTQMGYYDIPIDQHPQKERVRAKANHYLTGRDGGREIDLRQFALEGMQLYGRLKSLHGESLEFQDDLQQNLDQADATAANIKAMIDQYIAEKHLDAPTEEPYQPVWQPPLGPRNLQWGAAGIAAVIWCMGYRSDFSWIDVPVFDGRGYPGHERGVTAVEGLYFIGLPWLYTWGSGRFSGIALDAEYLARRIHRCAERTTSELLA